MLTVSDGSFHVCLVLHTWYGEDVAEEAQYFMETEHQRIERIRDQRQALSDVLPPVRSLQLGPTSQIAQPAGNT